MPTLRPPFARVMLDPRAEGLPFTRALLSRLPTGMPVQVQASGDPPPKGRQTLFVTVEPGAFLKDCPCTPGAVRCGYAVFTLGFQCPIRCSYCFLRFYAPDEPLTLYANLEDAERGFAAWAAKLEGPARVGTGEFTDSLALDPWTGHAGWLHGLARKHPRALLELKTKTARVEGLLEREPLPNVIPAWSVNPPEVVAAEEPGSATLDERLDAARRAARAGYRVAFHFDPVIFSDKPGRDEAAYREVIRRLAETARPAGIAWVSLGTLRFPPVFLDAWGSSLRGNPIFFDEFVRCPDGKLRYFWPKRKALYRSLAAELERRLPGVATYLCMEDAAMWGASMGGEPEDLPSRLSR